MESKMHPTQKPLSLMRWCLKWTDAQTIIDPFAGSGTTLLAAKLEGRKAVGIEISEEYCEIAANRLRQRLLF
jgi:DNA modification methylase